MKLNRASLKDQALAVIRESMLSGEIRPGETYSAAGMAARLGTSNGPVREAMLTLVEQGIMQVVPNVGFQVTPLTEDDLAEIYELRVMLEVPAMRRLAEQGIDGRDEQPRRHAEACARAAANGDVKAFITADRDFHLVLLDLVGNARLAKIVANLRDQTRLYGLNLAGAEKLRASAAELTELVDALVGRDPDRAERVMTSHLAQVRQEWAPPEQTPESSPQVARSPVAG
ncbi:GntR family transcriptional regulator [Georgenia deserti]|uniref:GntR family transcriptional regulator n=1 Tax=Georgenia deserti TaxID=2093781 RepID=A0ABW4L7Q3_9MICO